jgi:hypothetical protein
LPTSSKQSRPANENESTLKTLNISSKKEPVNKEVGSILNPSPLVSPVVTVEPKVTFFTKTKKILPEFTDELKGHNPVRVRNPNEFAVAAGIRSGNKGKNLDVPAIGVKTGYIPPF